MEINVRKIKDQLDNEKAYSIEAVRLIGEARKQLPKRKQWKEFTEQLEITKDKLSLSLKRFFLLELGFSSEFISDSGDREIKKLTHKRIEEVAELQKARLELAKGEISYQDFCEEFDKYKIVKTVGEKLISKAEGVIKFIDKNDCNEKDLTEAANILKPFVDEWGLKTKEGE